MVVRGIAGERAEYRPIQSALVEGAAPVDVATAFRDTFGLSDVYLADLDAIAGAEPAWPLYAALLELGLRLWVDAGIGEPDRAAALASLQTSGRQLARIVAGLESLASTSQLADFVRLVGPDRFVFSLDLKAGQPLTEIAAWRDLPADAIAAAAVDVGTRSMIVLDLADVGSLRGGNTTALCRRLRAAHPRLEIVSGGGVRHLEDVRSFLAAGCDAVLVASALHDGRIAPAELAG